MASTVKYKDAKKECKECVEMIYYGGNYYTDVEELLEAFYEEPSDAPNIVHGTYRTKVAFDAGQLLEEAYECAEIETQDMTEIEVQSLQIVLDNWVESNARVYYQPDYSYRIDIREEVKEWELSLES